MADILPTEDQLRDWITNGAETPHRRNKYPPEAIDDTLWLRGYASRRCGDDLNKIVEHARAKGFNNDQNYFYQVLTARYFRTTRSDDGTIKVAGSWKNLRELVMQLKVYDRFVAVLSQVRFVETTVWDRINQYIQIKRTPFNCCRIGAIVGYTGNQKSECFREMIRREKPGQILRIEAPDQPSLSLMLHELGVLFGADNSKRLAYKRLKIVEGLNETGRVLIIDNAQRCYNWRAGEHQPIFDYIQKLQEDTQCTIILCWTPVDKRFDSALASDYFEQFIGRIGGEREILRLEEYPCDEDIERIVASFGLEAGEIDSLMPRLRALVKEKGRIRNLFNALQTSSRLANVEKKKFCGAYVVRYLGE